MRENSSIRAFGDREQTGAHEAAERKILEKKFLANGAAHFDGARQAFGHFLAGAVGNQCDALTGLDREARLDRIASSGNQFLLCRFDLHLRIVILPFVVFHSEAAKGDQNHPPSASTTIAGT